jgi:hypothetical protein
VTQGPVLAFARWGIVLALVTYIGTCSIRSAQNQSAFLKIQNGSTTEDVIELLGPPARRETAEAPFTRYGARPCDDGCKVRFWYENRLTLDTEAWSIEFNDQGEVIKTSHWISP